LEHCGPNYDNDLGYRSREEYETWRKRCPIENYGARLRADGVVDAAWEQQLGVVVERDIAEAFAFAEASPFPPPGTAAEGVYA
jgi:pyruvate dehydrogenase E1 component alpha subunit